MNAQQLRDYIKNRREYIGRACTLNGNPAKIVIDGNGLPSVAPLNPDLGVIPYSWVAVFNIIDNRKGEF